MSIFPATDIISDVARAANPHKAQAAMKRLNDFAAARTSPAQNFAAIVDRSAKPAAQLPTLAGARVDSRAITRFSQDTKPPAVAAAEKFEAYILQTWLEVLLPKAEGALYGSDGSGSVWRSMMAEQLGGQIAKSGGVGLQRVIGSGQSSSASHNAGQTIRT